MTDLLDQQLAAISREFAKPSISDFLARELDRKVAAMSSDSARRHFLAEQLGSWAERYRVFARTGAQPFGGPHPQYGEMQAPDFVVVIGAIQSALAIVKARIAADA